MTTREVAADPVEAYAGVPAALRVSTLVLSVLGLVAAAYLSFEHLTSSTSLACPETGRVNCVKVTTSSYSSFLGIPVALLGLVFFLVLLPLVLPVAWRAASPLVHRARLTWVSIGLVSVLYLVWAELFRIHAICLWCTGVHVAAALVFFLVVFGEAFRTPVRTR